MNLRTFAWLILPLLLAAVLCPLPEQARGCAPAPPRGKAVEIADESAIILWDAATKTQHFIRRASFNTEAAEFGFLVPTPTKPEVEPAGDEAFTELARVTAPKVITKPRSEGGGCALACGTASGPPPRAAADKSSVRVLEEKRLPGHNVSILEADSADDLSKWLGKHGFEYSEALTKWVEPYVKQQWKITAFEYVKDAPKSKELSSSAVRMTFKTEVPFFPYREPASQSTAPAGQTPKRLLRVFFIGDKRVGGKIGESSWPGTVAWSNQVQGADREKVLQMLKLPAETPPASWWLTEFEDHSSPRPGTDDVFFTPSEDQKPVEREPIIQYVSNAAVAGVLWYGTAACLALPYFIGRWRRRAKPV
jgi:hypothetical protein